MRCFSSGQSLFCIDPASKSCDRAKYRVRAPFSFAHFAEKGGSRMALSIGRIKRDGSDAMIVASRGPFAEAVIAVALL